MKHRSKTSDDTGRGRKRTNLPVELAIVGVLSGLAVSAWGSYFATTSLYPSYVAAFVTSDAADQQTVTVAKLDQPAVSQGVVMAAAPSDVPPMIKPTDDIRPLTDTPEKIAPVPDLSPEAFARLSTADESLRSGASLANGQPTALIEDRSVETAMAAISSTPPEPRAAEMTETPILAEPTALAVAVSPRPIFRPRTASMNDTPLAAVGMAEEGTFTTSSMNAPSRLAVLVSPRPRALPNGLRSTAALKAPDEEVASTQVSLQSPEPEIRAAPRWAGKGCGRNLASSMPNRHKNAVGGNQFLASVGNESGSGRDHQIITELAKGNMPSFLHDLQPVVLSGRDSRGGAAEIIICVTPDYLALGSDRDFVRVPMGLPAAASIAGQFGMTLPTSRMVDAIYAQASVRLSPAPMPAGPQMSSTAYFLRHNATVEAQRHGRNGLIAGHKKDLVMANRMSSNPGRVAIYGWHRSKGDPIQPVSTVHGASYADYSHGIRLVSTTAYLNGKAVNLEDLLSSSRYAYLLNTDGPLPGAVIQVASR